jgi:hypothetical protein
MSLRLLAFKLLKLDCGANVNFMAAFLESKSSSFSSSFIRHSLCTFHLRQETDQRVTSIDSHGRVPGLLGASEAVKREFFRNCRALSEL